MKSSTHQNDFLRKPMPLKPSRYIFGVLMMVLSGSGIAGPDRATSLAELARIAGVDRAVQHAQADAAADARTKIPVMVGQIRNQLPDLSQSQQKAYQQAVDRFLDRVGSPYDAQAAATQWAEAFAADLSDEEVAKLLQFGRTPIGRKQMQASLAAAMKLRAHLQSTRAGVTDAATADLMARLREILADDSPTKSSTSAKESGHVE
jgi:hypothetical protein